MIVRPHSRRWQPACAQRGRAISPHVGDVPLSEFTLDDADLVMANIPATKSTATRRQVAQVVRRVLGLAVYPARHIKENPIPRGWLPKVKRTKAFTYLYPEEDRALLACTGSLSRPAARTPPLLWRPRARRASSGRTWQPAVARRRTQPRTHFARSEQDR